MASPVPARRDGVQARGECRQPSAAYPDRIRTASGLAANRPAGNAASVLHRLKDVHVVLEHLGRHRVQHAQDFLAHGPDFPLGRFVHGS